jgi:hypothetical protein
MVIGPESFSGKPGKRTFIHDALRRKTNGEGAYRFISLFRSETEHCGRVDPTAQKESYRNITDHVELDCFVEKFDQLLLQLA